MTPPYLSHEHPIRMAHRGSRILWPENTMVAFQAAIDLGYRYLETDVQLTKDGTIVAFHDRTLERLTNATGPLHDWWWEELQLLDAAYRFDPERGYPLRSSGVGIPSLEEVVTTFPDAMVNVDLKASDVVDPVATFVERHSLHDRVLIGSFFDNRLARFRRRTGGKVATSAGPAEVTAFWLASRTGRSIPSPADAFQVPPRRGRIELVDGRFIRAVHGAGKQVHVWTVNDRDEMRRLLAAGVDGIISDRPDLLDAVIAERSNGEANE